MDNARTLRQVGAGAAVLLTTVLAADVSPAVGFLPYRLILGAARSPERPLAFVHDKVLRLNLHKALVEADPEATLSVSPYVFAGHGYLVGWTTDDAEREKLEGAARSVVGLSSLSSYLPVKPTGPNAPKTSSELALKLKVEEAITLQSKAHRMNVSVKVLGTHVVLTGVVASVTAVQSAGQAARDTQGVSGVTSFLTVPEPGNEKLLGGLLP